MCIPFFIYFECSNRAKPCLQVDHIRDSVLDLLLKQASSFVKEQLIGL